MNGFIDAIIAWVTQNPQWSFIVVFLVSLSESLAFVGLIVPGSVALAAIGLLIGTGSLPLYETLISAMLGAIIGDCVSFFIGRHYLDRIHTKWPFIYFQNLIKKGELFFVNHGKKSVFLGRFVGPVRPVLPLIAGSLKMNVKSFIITDTISGILWAPAYILPGAFIAYTGFSLNYKTKTILYYCLVTLALILLCFWIYKAVILPIIHKIDAKLSETWNNTSITTITFLQNLDLSLPLEKSNPNTPRLLALSLFFGICFLAITYQVITSGFLVTLNHQLLQFCQSLNLSETKTYIVSFTLIAEPTVMVGLYIVILLYFIFCKRMLLSLLWFINGAMAGGGAYIIKKILNMPRPEGIERSTSSFPSAHTVLVIVLLGMLYMLAKTKKSAKPLGIILLVIIVAMISSRLLLSAHWMTDILGGITWSLACLCFNGALIQGITLKMPEKRYLILLSIITVCILWSFEVYLNLPTEVQSYDLKGYENIAHGK